MNKIKFSFFKISISIFLLTYCCNSIIAQQNLIARNLTLNSPAGDNIWYWKMYREGNPSSPLNESLVFSRKRDEGDVEHPRMVLTHEGRLGVNTTEPKNTLSVNGTIWGKEVIVSFTDGADWVFEPSYKLRSLSEVEIFIEKNKHLPEIPSAEEFRKNDMKVSEMTNKLLQKIEELTLYTIAQEKKLNILSSLEERLQIEEEQNKILEARLLAIESLLAK